jgi:hypothetical protein
MITPDRVRCRPGAPGPELFTLTLGFDLYGARAADSVLDDVEPDEGPHLEIVEPFVHDVAFVEEEFAPRLIANVSSARPTLHALDMTDHRLIVA